MKKLIVEKNKNKDDNIQKKDDKIIDKKIKLISPSQIDNINPFQKIEVSK